MVGTVITNTGDSRTVRPELLGTEKANLTDAGGNGTHPTRQNSVYKPVDDEPHPLELQPPLMTSPAHPLATAQ